MLNIGYVFLMMFGFYCFFVLAWKERSWLGSLLSTFIWFILAGNSMLIEVPGVTGDFQDFMMMTVFIGLGFISLILLFINFFDYEWENKQPIQLLRRQP